MAGKELNERVVSVQEGDVGEVIDRELFDYFKESMEECETKQPKQKPKALVTVIKKINLNNGRRNEDEEKHGIYCYSNDEDEDDEIEEGGIEDQNEKKDIMNLNHEIEDKMYAEQHKNKRDVKEMAIEEDDTNVEIERVAMEETMWEEKMEGSLQEGKEKKGFLKKIMEKWT